MTEQEKAKKLLKIKDKDFPKTTPVPWKSRPEGSKTKFNKRVNGK